MAMSLEAQHHSLQISDIGSNEEETTPRNNQRPVGYYDMDYSDTSSSADSANSRRSLSPWAPSPPVPGGGSFPSSPTPTPTPDPTPPSALNSKEELFSKLESNGHQVPGQELPLDLPVPSKTRSSTEMIRTLQRLHLLTELKLDEIKIGRKHENILRGIPDEFLNLRVTLIKATIIGRYDIIPGPLVKTLLQESNLIIPKAEPGTKGPVFLSHVAGGPQEMFLQWKLQEDRLFLINRWLTDLVDFRKLPHLRDLNLDQNLEGRMVACPLPGSLVDVDNSEELCRIFGRGIVLNVGYAENIVEVEVFLPDYGSSETFLSLDDLWIAPKEVSEILPLCFKAHFVLCDDENLTEKESNIKDKYNFGNPDPELQGNAVADFSLVVQECTPYWKQKGLMCQIRNVRQVAGESDSYGVQLWQSFGDQTCSRSPVRITILLDIVKEAEKEIKFQIESSQKVGVERQEDDKEALVDLDPQFQDPKVKTVAPAPSKTPNQQRKKEDSVETNGHTDRMRSSNYTPTKSDPMPMSMPTQLPMLNQPNSDPISASMKLAYQLHPDQEVEIKPYDENDFKCMRQYKIVHITSPGEFQLEYVPNDGGVGIRNWWKRMQVKCSEAQYRSTYKIRGDVLYKNRSYVWKDVRNNSWNRIKMLEPSSQKSRSSRAWAVDLGCEVQVKFDDLLEIEPRLCILRALAFTAYLAHVQPSDAPRVNSTGDSVNTWSKISTNYFKSISSKKKIFLGIILETRKDLPKSQMTAHYADEVAYGMVLAEKEFSVGTVQASLVQHQLATSTGFSTGAHDFAHMLKAHGNKEYSEPVPVPVPVLFNKFKCSSLLSQDADVMKHVIPDAMALRLGCVTISSNGTGPGCFFIMMENSATEFYKLHSDLGHEYPRMTPIPAENVMPGMIVVGRALDKESFSDIARVVILYLKEESATSPGPGVKAYGACIDTGEEFLVNLETVRKLPPQFQSISPFCQRAHLDTGTGTGVDSGSGSGDDDLSYLVPSYGLCSWTSATKSTWRRYMSAWQTEEEAGELKMQIYFAWQPQQGVIQLEEYGQELILDQRRSMSWAAGKATKTGLYSAVDKQRGNPLLKHLYSSVGISLVYETVGSSEFFEFSSLSDFLESTGCATRIPNPMQ